MTTTKTVVSLLAALAAGATAFAQTDVSTPVESNGLLGQRYVEAGLGFIDVNNSRVDAFGAGLTVNLPVAPSFDVSADYAYSWVESFSEVDAHQITANGTYYIQAEQNLKTFARVSLGYAWADWDNHATWGVSFGAEFQLAPQVVVTASAGYDDDFESGDNGAFDATVTGHYWFTRQVGAFAAVSYIEGGNYGLFGGVNVKF